MLKSRGSGMAESSSSSVHDEMDLEDQQQRQQTASPLIRLSRHASLTEDSSYTNGKEQYEKILPSSSQDVPSSSTASSLPISASRYREAWVSVMIFLLGWKIPKIVQERTIPSEPPPYQVLEKSGDVVLDLGLSFPLVEPPTIPGNFLVWTSVWIPLGAVALLTWFGTSSSSTAQPVRRIDTVTAMSSFLMAIGISEFVTQTLKVVIRRRRPNFYELCGFDIATRTCNGPLEHVKEAQYSFPSGHSSLAACAMVYICWILLARIMANPKLSISQKRHWSFGSCFLLLGWTVFVGTTRLIDHWHHFSDVVAGLWLGGMVASLVFHFHYPPFSVIPWIRHNPPYGSALPMAPEQPW